MPDMHDIEHADIHQHYVQDHWSGTGVTRDAFDWIRFTRLENLPLLRRRDVDAATRLQLWTGIAGCATDDLASAVEYLERQVERQADVIEDETSLEPLRALASPESRVIAVGDSITADRTGWAAILESLLKRIDPSVTFANAAIAGTTSTDTVERLDLIAATRPDVVLLMIGTNDARMQRLIPGIPLVSERESRQNLSILHNALTGIARRVIVLTPPPIRPEAGLAAMRDRGASHASLAENLDGLAEHIRTLGRDVVDLRLPPVFDPADPRVMDEDGVHPTISGQAAIAKALIRHLS